jgi:hypothetical protein
MSLRVRIAALVLFTGALGAAVYLGGPPPQGKGGPAPDENPRAVSPDHPGIPSIPESDAHALCE